MNRHQPQPNHQRQPQASSKLQGNDWFAGAPASQVLLTFGVALYMVIHDASATWQLDSEALIGNYNTTASWYRLLSSKVTFLTTGELIVGTSLQFYLYRRYERELGTRKFVAFWLFVHVMSIAQELAVLQIILVNNRVRDMSVPLRWSYSGPYSLVGALFALFHCYAPRLHPRFVSALGFHFSEKSLYYGWFFYLTCSGGWHTLLSTATGAVGTVIYINLLQANLDVPDRLVQTVQPFFERLGLAGAAPTIRAATVASPAGAAATATVAAIPRHEPLPPSAPAEEFPMPEPDAEAVEQLTAMGFPQEEVMAALRQAHNNVEHAANRLLSGS